MLFCGQVVSIGVSHPKYLTCKTLPANIYVKSGKLKVHLFKEIKWS